MGTNKVGENIKKLRTESGLSQKEVAQAIGRSESQIGAYENGSVDMPLSVLFKIAACLKCAPEELITGKQEKPEKKWDAELKIFHQQDRLTMIQILAKNLPMRIYQDCVKEEPELVNSCREYFGKLCQKRVMKLIREIEASRK